MPDKVETAAEKLAEAVEEKRALEAAATKPAERIDEGGHFIVDGQAVDANGEPVKGSKS